MRSHQALLVQAYLEAGKIVYLASPAGSIIAKQEDGFCAVQFLEPKIHGRAADCFYIDDLNDETMTKKKRKALLKWYTEYKLKQK